MSNHDPCSPGQAYQWYWIECNGGDVVDLYPYENQVSGTLPSEIGLLTELTYISLPSNALDGTLPTEMGELTKMRESHSFLYDNWFTGPVPTEMGRWTSMTGFLDFEDNLLTGTLPTELGKLTKMSEVFIFRSVCPLFCVPPAPPLVPPPVPPPPTPTPPLPLSLHHHATHSHVARTRSRVRSVRNWGHSRKWLTTLS